MKEHLTDDVHNFMKIYDEEWADAHEILGHRRRPEKDIAAILLEIVQVIFITIIISIICFVLSLKYLHFILILKKNSVKSRSLESNQTKIKKNENCRLGFIESAHWRSSFYPFNELVYLKQFHI